MKILIDADACPRPVMAIVVRLQSEYGYELITVASFNHNLDGVNHIVVGDESQAADMALINRTGAGDIIVTQDWGLAALAIGKGAAAISPLGKIFKNDTIDFLLEERYLKAKLRRSGKRLGGPAARTQVDDQQFEFHFRALLKMV